MNTDILYEKIEKLLRKTYNKVIRDAYYSGENLEELLKCYDKNIIQKVQSIVWNNLEKEIYQYGILSNYAKGTSFEDYNDYSEEYDFYQDISSDFIEEWMSEEYDVIQDSYR